MLEGLSFCSKVRNPRNRFADNLFRVATDWLKLTPGHAENADQFHS